ncbi:hypothetical protein SAMN04515671_2858 [Nakamurella panacisegetis]|uniref:Uncharacterized protein n=2 Tax=Nakamurella panacisegetis TaxID=1090615 RepID=A0A1H0PNJ4_9ACTN|nr:hypothetical protein SAMN04515671_2858 [Nakamurella panacisegetis]
MNRAGARVDEDDRILSELHDPEWAKRVAAIEKEFRKAERKRSPAPLARPTRTPRRFRAAYIWTVVVIGVLAYAAIAKPWGVQGRIPVANQPDPIVTVDQAAPTTSSPTTAAQTAVDEDPFAGSPAALWPTADKGVIMPTATAVGPLSAAQVRHSLDVAHRYLLTARTDPRVLTAHQTGLLRSMIVPAELATSAPVTGPNSVLRPTLLAPGFKLAAPIRVNGTVAAKYASSSTRRVLVVTTNLVWAYALVPQADSLTTGDDIVVLHEKMTLDLYPSDPTWKDKVWITDADWYTANIDCAYVKQGLLALPRIDDPSRAPRPSGVVPTGSQVFDPKTPLDMGGSCL